jgi:hypothetical protein
VTEPVPERNLRVFREEVLGEMLDAVRPMALGGEVELESADAGDTRVRCVIAIRYRLPDDSRALLRLEFVFNTRDQRTLVYWDFNRNGRWASVNLGKHIILWRNPLTGREYVIRYEAFDRAVAALRRLPRDHRTEAEAVAYEKQLRELLRPLLGRWYQAGDPNGFVSELHYTAEGHLARTIRPPGLTWQTSLAEVWVDRAGRIHRLPHTLGWATLSPDGQRLTFSDTGDWWSREPVTGRGK